MDRRQRLGRGAVSGAGFAARRAAGQPGSGRAGALAGLALTFACAPPPAGAGEPPAVELEPMVVTATGRPTPLGRVAGSVTVIGPEEIARRQLRTLGQALAGVPGVRLVPLGGAGQQTSAFIRGASSGHTLVLIDGVRANDPSSPTGAFDFAGVSLDNVERIEVVRGPLSTLYGSDAIGGVVQIVSRRAGAGARAAARVEGGSDDAGRLTLEGSGASAAFDASLSASLYRTSGDSVTPARLRAGASAERDAYRDGTLAARLGLAAADHLDLAFTGRWSETETELDPGAGEDPDARIEQRQGFLRGEARAELLGGRWESLLAVDHARYDRRNRNDPRDAFDTRERAHYRGERTAVRWQNDLLLARDHVLTAGAEAQRERADNRTAADLGGFPLSTRTDAEAGTRALFLQDALDIGATTQGTLGVRLDDHEDFGAEATWRVAAAHTFEALGTRLSATVGTGFKAPTLDQLYGVTASGFGVFRGNPDLEPERSRGWEAGFEQPAAGGRASLGATYFASRVEDLIALALLPNGDSTLENRDQARLSGVEVNLGLRPTGALALSLGYTYTDARDQDQERLLRRPRHQLVVTADWEISDRAGLSVQGRYVDDWEDLDRVRFERVRPPGYGVVDLAVRFALSPRVTLLGRVENLLDQGYEPASGFAGPDRAILVGLEGALW
jgi:vitamin B12 transporter